MPFPIDPACITSNMSVRLDLSYRKYPEKSSDKIPKKQVNFLYTIHKNPYRSLRKQYGFYGVYLQSHLKVAHSVCSHLHALEPAT